MRAAGALGFFGCLDRIFFFEFLTVEQLIPVRARRFR